ncbi:MULTISPECIES: hypothetical protein [Streptomyces]|uniref:hypothetical protein n=1 Tax=Streptomyces TaxID=1883 RepID=UPI000F7A1EB6|nr:MULTISPECIES: hypothetical protein [Streptomyces]RST06462.1 hypothetical protein EF910_08770 [Streptomyces sp. WAC07149]GLX16874.1 hypothetical protein Slala01_05180 [Streptomyces lavendulae subsp. lavendulae]GLX25497.1 hypothetical protein Slala02_13170 [Streptomyces lavendulae subsp. lavendulae]
MQLRRAALPLSLLALLASAGCVSVGAESGGPDPARGSVPPADAPDASGAPDVTGARHAPDPPPEPPLPLGELPEPEAAPEPAPRVPPPARRIRPPAQRPAKPAAPRRARPPEPPARRVPPPPRGEELCEAAEGTVPPSIVDLCVRQYGR